MEVVLCVVDVCGIGFVVDCVKLASLGLFWRFDVVFVTGDLT